MRGGRSGSRVGGDVDDILPTMKKATAITPPTLTVIRLGPRCGLTVPWGPFGVVLRLVAVVMVVQRDKVVQREKD